MTRLRYCCSYFAVTLRLLHGATIWDVCVEHREITTWRETLPRNSQDFPGYLISIVNLISRWYYLILITYIRINNVIAFAKRNDFEASPDYNNFPQCLLHFPCFCLLMLFLVPWQMSLESGYFAGDRFVMTVTPWIFAHSCKHYTWTVSNMPILQHTNSRDL